MRSRTTFAVGAFAVLFLFSGGGALALLNGAADDNPRAELFQQGQESSCVTCHRALEGPDAEEGVVHDYTNSIHAAKGLDCSECHGGNPDAPVDLESFDYTAAKGPGTGFRGIPDRQDIPDLCGRCHSDPAYMRRFTPQMRVDQEQLYWTSGHGQRLREGNTKVATCVDCHSNHSILPASDPRSTVAPHNVPATCQRCHSDPDRMAGSRFSITVSAEYFVSVHAAALLDRGETGAPACNDCHGNHGALPPGISSISAVCSQCHVSNASDFENSPHGPAFAALGEPTCEVCHGNHAIQPTSDAMLSESGICAACHAPSDRGMAVATSILGQFRNLERAISDADSSLGDARRVGMDIDGGLFSLLQARNALVRGRATVHTFSETEVQSVTDPGIAAANEAREFGREALIEARKRRGGWVVFLAVSILLVVGLAMLIRRLEGPGGKYPLREPDDQDMPGPQPPTDNEREPRRSA